MENTNTTNSIYKTTSPSVPTYNNDTVVTTPYMRKPYKEEIEVLDFREKMGRKLGLATLIYAAFSTLCLYRNVASLSTPFFGIATLIYMIYGLKQYDVKIKKFSWFYATILMALSISDFLTANTTFIFFNNIGIFLMIFVFLLHNVYDDRRWNFSKTALAILESVVSSIGTLDEFRKDMNTVRSRRKTDNTDKEKRKTCEGVFIGLVISVPILITLLALLSNADVVFSKILNDCLVFDFDFGKVFFVSLTFLFIFLSAYCIMRFFSKKSIKEEVSDHRHMEPVIAITVLSLISVIYLLFSVVQIVYLFLGNGTLPDGYTYSQYAREGFFELLAVSIINFVMVLFINNYFKESRLLKALMTIISLCTYIMIASSFMRIMMYINAALLTHLRIWVLWGLAVLSLLFVAVIISIYKHGFPLFKYSIIVVSILYALLSFARPDYIIAKYNLTYMNTIEKGIAEQDYDYLENLSTDAAVVIKDYKDDWADRYFIKFNDNSYLSDNTRWRKFNLSVYNAKVCGEGR